VVLQGLQDTEASLRGKIDRAKTAQGEATNVLQRLNSQVAEARSQLEGLQRELDLRKAKLSAIENSHQREGGNARQYDCE
jgi:uncharacterized coiled-coil protein SlyX